MLLDGVGGFLRFVPLVDMSEGGFAGNNGFLWASVEAFNTLDRGKLIRVSSCSILFFLKRESQEFEREKVKRPGLLYRTYVLAVSLPKQSERGKWGSDKGRKNPGSLYYPPGCLSLPALQRPIV
jgi:hypothetical protein